MYTCIGLHITREIDELLICRWLRIRWYDIFLFSAFVPPVQGIHVSWCDVQTMVPWRLDWQSLQISIYLLWVPGVPNGERNGALVLVLVPSLPNITFSWAGQDWGVQAIMFINSACGVRPSEYIRGRSSERTTYNRFLIAVANVEPIIYKYGSLSHCLARRSILIFLLDLSNKQHYLSIYIHIYVNSRQKLGWHRNCRARSLSACNARPL